MAVHYFDYKSPYAYLAQQETFALRDEARARGVELRLLPYTLDIPSFLGEAELDAARRDVVGTRSEHQWRRVRYAYADCRREARRRGLVLRGPRRIFDSSVAHIGFLFAAARGDFRAYHDAVYERFFRRELDPGDPAAVEALLDETGVGADGFPAWLAGPGRKEHDRIRAEAEAAGVFGVPSYVVDGELYWGGERIDRVRECLLGDRSGE